MASIGHVAVGMLLGRAYEARSVRERVVALTTFGGLALLPDADVALVALGLDYHGPTGTGASPIRCCSRSPWRR